MTREDELLAALTAIPEIPLMTLKDGVWSSSATEPTHAFIAAARTALPALIAGVRQERAENALLRHVVKEMLQARIVKDGDVIERARAALERSSTT